MSYLSWVMANIAWKIMTLRESTFPIILKECHGCNFAISKNYALSYIQGLTTDTFQLLQHLFAITYNYLQNFALTKRFDDAEVGSLVFLLFLRLMFPWDIVQSYVCCIIFCLIKVLDFVKILHYSCRTEPGCLQEL